MRLFSLLLPLGLFVACLPGAWAADAVPDGWNMYKFGMTIEQVRAVPGIAWGEIENTKSNPAAKCLRSSRF